MPGKPKEPKVPKQPQQVGEWPALKLTEKWWDPILIRWFSEYANLTIPQPISIIGKEGHDLALKYLDEVYPHFAAFVELYRKAKLMPAPVELPPQKSNPDNDLRLNSFGFKRYRDQEQREAFMVKASEHLSKIDDSTEHSDFTQYLNLILLRLLPGALGIWKDFLEDKLLPASHYSAVTTNSNLTRKERGQFSNEMLALFCHGMFMTYLCGDSAPIKRFRVGLVFD